ncbi:histidine phosphatase family protein [Massilia sp. CCM 8695]|uniref:Histidine phosphatase family protein n=1 Tax=Massilia frigida TaxID=2609281 RepID=A0ABX0N9F1_9BURK|nr:MULTISPECIES: histidine phosphatase family protein [Massilia]MDM5178990.1 histidine phosphatase family protein [Massilia sp. DJPM01]NHZ82052.1 histidine phosphatase family protein [Massilia frigida]
MSPTNIILIRHGETAWNAERRLQGHIDIALNDEGLRQAAALADALNVEQLDLVVSSDLQRAAQTADAVARLRAMPVQRDPLLRERCFGGFEGLLYAEIEQRFPVEFAAWQARQIDAPMPSGARVAETFRQFYQRAVAAIIEWGRAHPGQTLALVAHGGVLECAYRAALGLSLETPRDFPVLNASINRFRVLDGKLSLVSWGEVGHLQPRVLDELS